MKTNKSKGGKSKAKRGEEKRGKKFASFDYLEDFFHGWSSYSPLIVFQITKQLSLGGEEVDTFVCFCERTQDHT